MHTLNTQPQNTTGKPFAVRKHDIQLTSDDTKEGKACEV